MRRQTLSSEGAVRNYRQLARMLANVEDKGRMRMQPWGTAKGKRAKRTIAIDLYPIEFATFMGNVAVGTMLNGKRTKAAMLAIVRGKQRTRS